MPFFYSNRTYVIPSNGIETKGTVSVHVDVSDHNVVVFYVTDSCGPESNNYMFTGSLKNALESSGNSISTTNKLLKEPNDFCESLIPLCNNLSDVEIINGGIRNNECHYKIRVGNIFYTIQIYYKIKANISWNAENTNVVIKCPFHH